MLLLKQHHAAEVAAVAEAAPIVKYCPSEKVEPLAVSSDAVTYAEVSEGDLHAPYREAIRIT